MDTLSLYRELDTEEEKEFRQWARDNFDIKSVNTAWHPVVRDEWEKITDDNSLWLVSLTKEKIDDIFSNSDNQSDVIIKLYKALYPNRWDDIEKLNSFPVCSDNMGQYIFKKFIDFDKKYHPDVINGGAWLNSGFSTLDNENIPDWYVNPCDFTLIASIGGLG